MKTNLIIFFALIGILYSHTIYANVLLCDLDDNGIDEKIKLIKEPVKEIGGSFSEGYIEVESNGGLFTTDMKIFEFGNDTYIEVIRATALDKPFIGLYAPGGMHGITFFLYSFDGQNIKEVMEIFSNVQVIEIKDIDNDGVNEILSYSRNYNDHQAGNYYINVYKYINDMWQLHEGDENGL